MTEAADLADVAALDRLETSAFTVAVAPLFEGAPAFLRRLAAARPFGSAEDLFATARTIAHAMPEADQLELIDAHPRLGAARGTVSAFSHVEQGYDVPDRPADADPDGTQIAARLTRLNEAYEARFGFRYCVFVAGRPRAELLPELTAALGADRASEISRALDAVVDIARDRHAKMTR